MFFFCQVLSEILNILPRLTPEANMRLTNVYKIIDIAFALIKLKPEYYYFIEFNLVCPNLCDSSKL